MREKNKAIFWRLGDLTAFLPTPLVEWIVGTAVMALFFAVFCYEHIVAFLALIMVFFVAGAIWPGMVVFGWQDQALATIAQSLVLAIVGMALGFIISIIWDMTCQKQDQRAANARVYPTADFLARRAQQQQSH